VLRHRGDDQALLLPPQHNRYLGYLLDDFDAGVQALRGLVIAGYRPSVCRLYSPEDGAQHFAEIGRGKNIAILVAEGPAPIAAATADAISEAFAGHEPMDPAVVENWLANLNWGPDKIDSEKATMLADAHLGYTTEVSADWSRITELYERAIPTASSSTPIGARSRPTRSRYARARGRPPRCTGWAYRCR